ECLQALAGLDYPRERFEVIVVDDGSATSLERVVQRFRERLSLTLIRQPNAGPAAARNTGAARASGQFLAFTDDDCRPSADWLQAFAKPFGSRPDAALGGRTLNALPTNVYSTATQLLLEYVYAYTREAPERGPFFASNNLALPADGFRQTGGFDPSFPRAAAEDRELCDRWLRDGRDLAYAPEAVVHHTHALSLGTYWQLHVRYGRGAFRYHRARARRGAGPLKIRPSFYARLLFCRPPGRRGHRALLVSGLLVLSQVANAAGFAWEAIMSDDGGVPVRRPV
nr:glycosyltransferase [Chloroflexota bacterium]